MQECQWSVYTVLREEILLLRSRTTNDVTKWIPRFVKQEDNTLYDTCLEECMIYHGTCAHYMIQMRQLTGVLLYLILILVRFTIDRRLSTSKGTINNIISNTRVCNEVAWFILFVLRSGLIVRVCDNKDKRTDAQTDVVWEPQRG